MAGEVGWWDCPNPHCDVVNAPENKECSHCGWMKDGKRGWLYCKKKECIVCGRG